MRGVIIESSDYLFNRKKAVKRETSLGTKACSTSVDTLKEKLISAGLFMDHTGGLVIVEVDNLEEAEKVAKNDPAVLEEKFEYKVHPWGTTGKIIQK